MPPAEAPKADATFPMLAPADPSDNKLTTNAAVIKAKKAFTRKAMISPRTVKIPIPKTISGHVLLSAAGASSAANAGAV